MKRVWLRRDGRDRDFENERIKNKSMMACLNMEPYMSHLRRKVVDARFWLSSFYDQGLCSINFTTTRISPREASSSEVPAHTDRSEYAGCFPGTNPPTLKSDMKVRGTLATDLMAFGLPLNPSFPQSTSVILPPLEREFPISVVVGGCVAFEIGLADDVLVDEQDIPAPVPLLPGSYRTHLLADFCHQTSAHHIWSRRSISLKHRSPSFWCWGMSKGKENVIEVDDDELDFLPSLLTDPAFDPGIPLEPIRSSVGTSARRIDSDEEGSSGSENTLSEGRGDDSGEVFPSGVSRPEGRSTIGGRALSRDYAIDYMTCTTTFDELNDLRLRYNIPGEIPLKVPGKKDTPSQPPRGYVTLYLDSFKYGLRCPVQPYFAQILNGLNLSPGQLNPNGWRVLSGLFILWDRCCQSEPTVDEVKHLYQLKSSPKDAGWYYFQSSTKTRKPITDLPTGGGGNWKRKFFFAEGPWGQVAQIDGKDYRVPLRFTVPGCLLALDVLCPFLGCSFLAQTWPAQTGRGCASQFLLESRLILPGHKMKDAVIGALNRKRHRPQTTKRDQNKDAPTAKRTNIVQQVSPLKTLPPAPAKVGETSGATTDPASSSPLVGPRSRLPDSRAEHLVPYLNELSKLVSKKDLEDFDGCTLGELVGAM
ncbi:hypothetical protein WN944_016957 [Citrus x changshan-huyou]|uniref:Transposase (putative) gypsy type domain-containing protein n=1 Tax=Citrus x changshan-huyou TaxID=2935761 RepID=A0AAP0MAC3_9ROSI